MIKLRSVSNCGDYFSYLYLLVCWLTQFNAILTLKAEFNMKLEVKEEHTLFLNK
jgi:hypothetical protein